MSKVYLLRLEQKKWYVGIEEGEDWMERALQGEMCEWTKRYKPIEVSLIYNECSKYEIYTYIFRQMEMFGIDNVRGGTFSDVNLSNEDRCVLNRVIHNHCEDRKRISRLWFMCPCILLSMIVYKLYR